MVKTLGVMLGGIFVGAVGMEIMHRKYPHAFDKLYAKMRETASGAKEAFRSGYESAVRPQPAIEPST